MTLITDSLINLKIFLS